MKKCIDCKHHHEFFDDNGDTYYYCDNFKREESPNNPICSRFASSSCYIKKIAFSNLPSGEDRAKRSGEVTETSAVSGMDNF